MSEFGNHNAMIRVMLVDDHAIVRAGVKEMLEAEEDIEVVGEAASAEEALNRLESEVPPDVMVLDIWLPGLSGFELLHQVKRERPQLNVLALSMHPEQSFAVRAIRAGASGYVAKMAVPEELIEAIRTVGSGKIHITPQVAELLATDVGPGQRERPHERLSGRELQIFLRIAKGMTPALMAKELNLSVKTISTYRARILEKLNMTSNAEIAVYAVRNELLE